MRDDDIEVEVTSKEDTNMKRYSGFSSGVSVSLEYSSTAQSWFSDNYLNQVTDTEQKQEDSCHNHKESEDLQLSVGSTSGGVNMTLYPGEDVFYDKTQQVPEGKEEEPQKNIFRFYDDGTTTYSGNLTISNDSNWNIVSVKPNADGCLEVVKRRPSFVVYGNGQPAPDVVKKDIWGIDCEGKMSILRTINGKHTPAYQVAEKIEFDEDEPKDT